MATRLFSDMVNRLSPSAPGAPQPVLVTHIRDAAIEACERTLAWRYELPGVALASGTASYAYGAPADTEVHAIITSAINGVNAPSITLEATHRLYPKYPDNSASELSAPRYIVHIDPDTFYAAPIPDGVLTYTADMFVALKPLRTATGMDQATMDDLENVIIHGALQQLLVMPERTWSDKELAAYHAKQYAFKSAERRARTNVGAGRACLTAYAPPFA